MLKQVGYYDLERLLGEGGMGAVYLGVHRMTGRRVAIKMLRAMLADRPDLNARFFNEARTISFLEHPGIVRVFDVGRMPDGAAYMVMELCQGPTFGELLKVEKRVRVKLGVLGAVADALAHAHKQGVIHRDLKPDNVLVTGGADGAQPRVLDFGIAKVVEASLLADAHAVKTRTGAAMGTPLYMSPEQCRGTGGITPATDVYSLGVMMFEVLTGEVPFNGGVGEVIVAHLTTPPPDLEDFTTIDPLPGMAQMVRAMLEKTPANRPTMLEVMEALAPYAPALRELELAPPKIAAMIPAVDAPTVFTVPDPLSQEHTLPPVGADKRALWILAGALPFFVVAVLLWLRPSTHVPPTVVAPAPKAAPPIMAPPPIVAPPAWRIESTPSGAEVFTYDGKQLGKTPFDAGAFAKTGAQLVLKKHGYDEQLVAPDGSGVSSVHLRSRAPHPPSPLPRPGPPHTGDTFSVEPVH